MNVRIKWTGAIAALAVFSFGSVAAAQDWESGDTGAWGSPPPDQEQQQQQEQPPAEQQQPQQQQWQQQQQPQQQGWQQQQQQQQPAQQEQPPGWGETEAPPAAGDDDGQTDHELVVGHMGVGFFGVQGVSLSDDFTINAPTIGIRYWLAETVGLDIGLGFGFAKLSAESDRPDGVTSADLLSGFALTVHGGLPLALWHGQHYKFLIVPELNIGFGSGTQFGATPNDDEEFSAFFVDVGARAGTEIQFGFIDIPDLALQASVGVNLHFESQSREHTFGDPRGSTIDTLSEFSFGTTVQNNPWNIFIANISAIYYFR